MANYIDSLMIALGLETSEVEEGVKQTEGYFKNLSNAIRSEMEAAGYSIKENEGILAGMWRIAKEQSAEAAQEVNKTAEELQKVGEAAPAAKKAADNVKKIATEAKKSQQELRNLIKKITQLATPFLGGLGLNALIQQYTGATDQFGRMAKTFGADAVEIQTWTDAIGDAGFNANMFQMTMRRLSRQVIGTGKTVTDVLTELSTKTGADFDAMAKKYTIDPATLAFIKESGSELGAILEANKAKAYTKEDIEIGRKYAYVMGEVKDSFNMLVAIGMRAIVPAITKIAEIMEKTIEYLRKHEFLVKAAIIGIAAAITIALLPALTAMAAGAWAAIAPFLPLIAIIAAIVLVIEDLYVYMKGGKSALGDLWAIFGTGPEIMANLTKAWETFKNVAVETWLVIKDAFEVFWGYFGGVFKGMWRIVQNWFSLVKALFSGDFKKIWEEMKIYMSDIVGFIVDLIFSAFEALFDGITGIGKKVIPAIGKGLLNVATFGNADTVINAGKAAIGAITGTSASSATPAASSTTNNAGNTTTSVQVQKIEINAPNSDPKAIAQQTGNEVRKLANTGNRGVRQ